MLLRTTWHACRAAAVACGLLLAGASVSPLAAQDSTRPERPRAAPSDVESPEAIVAAVYDVISGAAAEERDWERFRSLFRPEGRLVPSGRGPSGEAGYQVLTVDEYVGSASKAFSKQGFFEREARAEIERFGDIAHVFSTYESRRSLDDAEPFQRGINSFQLWFDGDRWWILHVLWHAEREGAPIPDEYGG